MWTEVQSVKVRRLPRGLHWDCTLGWFRVNAFLLNDLLCILRSNVRTVCVPDPGGGNVWVVDPTAASTAIINMHRY